METFLTFLYTNGTNFGLKLLYALLVLVVGLRLIRWLMRRLEKGSSFHKLDAGLQSFLRSFLRIVLYILLALCLVGILDIPTTGFVTMLASCSVALGLALQGALGNFAGGLMLLFFKPFKVGDYVEASGYSGTVKAITVFYTVLSTVDNKTITLPNGNLTNAAVVNYSSEGIRRVDMTFSEADHSGRGGGPPHGSHRPRGAGRSPGPDERPEGQLPGVHPAGVVPGRKLLDPLLRPERGGQKGL